MKTNEEKTDLNISCIGWTCSCQGSKPLLSLLQLFILFNLETKEKKSLLTTAQSRRAETSAKDINPMSAVTSGIVPFVKQKKHSSQSVLLSSSADQGSPLWRQECIYSIRFLLTGGVKWCIKKMWWVGLFVFFGTYRRFTVCNCTCGGKQTPKKPEWETADWKHWCQ